ncbi:MAG: thiamine phosphate synthase [Bacteroidales bacterium]
MNTNQDLPTLQFITHATEKQNYVQSARIALECGFKWIQYRCKKVESTEDLLQQGLEIKQLCHLHQAIFTVNDYVELALELKADGVHLGKSDRPIIEARSYLGNNYIIGGTANTIEDIEHLYTQGANYIGLGPFRFTNTKEKLSPILGIEGYRNLTDLCRKKKINTPIYAIGGITAYDASEIKATGIYGLALSSAILQSPNAKEEFQKIYQYFTNN